MKYISTRGSSEIVTASQAILQGLALNKGLFVPDEFPKLNKSLEELINLSYKDLAFEILSVFITDFTEEELKYCINNAYEDNFDTEEIAPLKSVEDLNFLELFHGPTLAFKDMALSILPYLMEISAKKNNMNKKIAILTATSGDTGKAALEGFANKNNIDITVFYPHGGVSKVQELQMLTQEGKNVHVCAVKGNFDDCQTEVKRIFSEAKENSKFILSSANSINIGRLLPQVVYYFYAYGQLVKKGLIKCKDKINFTVPTGNFGNILAGFYAKNIGLPINKLICASNKNKVLYDFFKEKIYDKNREFFLTISPSMDILISSNLERLLYHNCGLGERINEIMEELSSRNKYVFKENMEDFAAETASEEETLSAIKEVFEKGYLIDTHTAVAYHSYKKYFENTGDSSINVIISTASPFKFTTDVLKAIDSEDKELGTLEAVTKLSELSGVSIPDKLKETFSKELLHKTVCEISEMEAYVYKNL